MNAPLIHLHRRRALTISFCIGITVWAGYVQAATISLPLPIDAGSSFDVTLTLGTENVTRSVSAAGQLNTTLTIDTGSGSAVVTGLQFTGGRFLTDQVNAQFQSGTVQSVLVGFGGDFSTPAPPTSVSGGQFSGDDQRIVLSRGLLVTYGSLFNVYDFTSGPIVSSGTGAGQVLLTETSRNGLLVTYDVSLNLPFSDQFSVGSLPLNVEVDGEFSTSPRSITVLVSEPQNLVLLTLLGSTLTVLAAAGTRVSAS